MHLIIESLDISLKCKFCIIRCLVATHLSISTQLIVKKVTKISLKGKQGFTAVQFVSMSCSLFRPAKSVQRSSDQRLANQMFFKI